MAAQGRLLPVVSTSRLVLRYRNDGQLRPATAIGSHKSVALINPEKAVLDQGHFSFETPTNKFRRAMQKRLAHLLHCSIGHLKAGVQHGTYIAARPRRSLARIKVENMTRSHGDFVGQQTLG